MKKDFKSAEQSLSSTSTVVRSILDKPYFPPPLDFAAASVLRFAVWRWNPSSCSTLSGAEPHGHILVKQKAAERKSNFWIFKAGGKNVPKVRRRCVSMEMAMFMSWSLSKVIRLEKPFTLEIIFFFKCTKRQDLNNTAAVWPYSTRWQCISWYSSCLWMPGSVLWLWFLAKSR